MTKIKYRVWNEQIRVMQEWNEVGCATGMLPLCVSHGDNPVHFHLDTMFETLQKEGVFLQSTGLFDKNGKEIYEGDIVSRFGDSQRSLVEFKDGCFVSIIQLSGCDEAHTEILCNDLSVTEIIGNIYENKDLLHEKNKV